MRVRLPSLCDSVKIAIDVALKSSQVMEKVPFFAVFAGGAKQPRFSRNQ
jgi:hypothetical protein